MLTDTAGAVRHLEARMDQRFTGVELRLTALDQKVDGKTDALNRKIDSAEARLEQKMDSHFRWLVGILFAMFIAMLSSFLAG